MNHPTQLASRLQGPFPKPTPVPGEDYAAALRAWQTEFDHRLFLATGVRPEDRPEPPKRPRRRPLRPVVQTMSRTEWATPLDDTCSICLEGLERATCVTTGCGHTFCGGCLRGWHRGGRRGTCPCCRAEVNRVVRYEVREEEGEEG